MNEILVCDKYEQIYPLIKEYDSMNTAALTQLENRVNAPECDYPAKNKRKRFTDDDLFLRNRSLGEGLEFVALINLQSDSLSGFGRMGKSYILDLSVPCDNGEEYYTDHESYRSLAELVRGLNKSVAETGSFCYGANIKPLLYTVIQENYSLTNEQKQAMKQLSEDPQLNELPFVERMQFKFGLWLMPRAKLNGLTEKERKKFERLYIKEDKK